VVRVADTRLRERGLQTLRVRPRVLAAAYTAPLPDVDEKPDIGFAECVEEPRERPAVNPDGQNPMVFDPGILPNRRTPLTWRPRGLSLGSSMSRTPNASKSIFAFVARIALR
jgi:hypothetical protein